MGMKIQLPATRNRNWTSGHGNSIRFKATYLLFTIHPRNVTMIYQKPNPHFYCCILRNIGLQHHHH